MKLKHDDIFVRRYIAFSNCSMERNATSVQPMMSQVLVGWVEPKAKPNAFRALHEPLDKSPPIQSSKRQKALGYATPNKSQSHTTQRNQFVNIPC